MCRTAEYETGKSAALAHVDELYRVAFFLLLDPKAAERAVEKAYRHLRQERSGAFPSSCLKVELLRCLLDRIEGMKCIPHRDAIGTSAISPAGCLLRVPRGLRIVLLLEAVGCNVAEIAAITGLPHPAALRRRDAAWECYFSACLGDQ